MLLSNILQLSEGNCTMEGMSMLSALSAGLGISPAVLPMDIGVAVRRPIPVLRIYNLVNVFDRLTWIALLVTILGLSGAMTFFYRFYSRLLPWLNNVKEVHNSEFFLRPFTAITEPDPIKWFKRDSSVKYSMIEPFLPSQWS